LKQLRNIFPVFWLTVLVFALSGRTVHVLFEHGHDHEFVCSEKSTHVHEKEHSCFICDFELQVSDGISPRAVSFDYSLPQQPQTLAGNVFVSSLSKFNFSLRGPPAA